MKKGFNQLSLHEDSRDITGFVILNRNFVYKRVPFGLKSRPKIFQKHIQEILLDCENCFVYIDDIVIFGKDDNEHELAVMKVLDKLAEYHVKLNLDKSVFRKERIETLGYIVEFDKIEAVKENLYKPLTYSKPTNKKNLQKILGLLNWYRIFIPNYSMKIKPLTDKLGKENGKIKSMNEFKWNEHDDNILKEIIKEVRDCDSLKIPDVSLPFILHTEARDYGIGAVLHQKHGVISYYSKKLSGAELNYTTIEKELDHRDLRALDSSMGFKSPNK